MATAKDFAHHNADRFLDELKEMLRIPSISTDPQYANDVRENAQWLVDHLNKIGMSAELVETDIHPLVYAEWFGAGEDAKTVLVYGHYDVQPAAVEDGWNTDPFEPVVKDNILYARGVHDDKGQLWIHVKAIEAMLASEEGCPVNLKLLLEGEEESGGKSIAKYVPAHTDKLAADVAVVSDTSMPSMDRPHILYALRGMVTMDLIVTGPESDLHSGGYGGTVHNPAQALCEIIAQLHNDDGSVAVPGFYDDVRSLADEERAELAKSPWTDAEWQAETGAPQMWGETAFTLNERRGARPTLEINGIAGGYAGAGFKTVLPARANAKISCRLVADQRPRKIFELVRDFIAEITPPTVRTELHFRDSGLPALVNVHDPAMQAAVRAYELGWGATPVFTRGGGTIPVVVDFTEHLNVPVALMGFGLNSDGIHGPNEHFALEMFYKGIDTAIHFYHEYAAL